MRDNRVFKVIIHIKNPLAYTIITLQLYQQNEIISVSNLILVLYIQQNMAKIARKERQLQRKGKERRNKMKKIKPRTACRNKVFSLDNYGKQMVNIFFYQIYLKVFNLFNLAKK